MYIQLINNQLVIRNNIWWLNRERNLLLCFYPLTDVEITESRYQKAESRC